MYQDFDRRQAIRPRFRVLKKLFGYTLLFVVGVCWGVLFFYGLTG